jgi:hypothetical protein
MMYPGNMAQKIKAQNYQSQIRQAEKNRLRAMDPNASKAMSEDEKNVALNRESRLLERIGGAGYGSQRPGQFVPDGEGGKRFIPRYRDISQR